MRNVSLSKIFKLTLPVATAYVPLGLALGVFMVSSDIAWFWAPVSALFIFAGSIEFLVVTFILAGYPIAAVAWTALVVNFRHIFYGLSFPLKSLRSLPQKAYGVFALTDETYGIVCAGNGKDLTGIEITLLQVTSHFWWVGAAFLGAVLGTFIPPEVTGFEFALTAMFITLAVDAVRNDPDKILILYSLVSCAFGLLMDNYVLDSSFLGSGVFCYLILISKDYNHIKNRSLLNE
ncbi:AzlC family ABC transporter permease [Endozoicomonas gorgoniicola]|uniref:AzlC family ABC transporter permease n=1 Tax=Endozoicomonas gorgoniicola TaxID=1234144 RepID=A0ABT3N3V3_9GAMM|nr:AzlC family ABC transporter permease [Endozoicomonas gorgoniicola]MCW7556018.1 AzlC family ABC transporter permease [Endozoicomonas gorgoniicola]